MDRRTVLNAHVTPCSSPARHASVVDVLREFHGALTTDRQSAWSQILWDNCCYLAADERRATAFALLKATTAPDRKTCMRPRLRWW